MGTCTGQPLALWLSHGNSGGAENVTYLWSSTCTNCVFDNNTKQEITRAAVHSGDNGTHTCTVTMESNETVVGNASINFNIVGTFMLWLHNLYRWRIFFFAHFIQKLNVCDTRNSRIPVQHNLSGRRLSEEQVQNNLQVSNINTGNVSVQTGLSSGHIHKSTIKAIRVVYLSFIVNVPIEGPVWTETLQYWWWYLCSY